MLTGKRRARDGKKGMRNVKNNEKKATTQLHAVVSRECLINILQFPLWLTAVHELSWGPEIDAEDQLNETISSIHPVLNVDVVPQPSSEPEWKFQFNVCFFRWENIFPSPRSSCREHLVIWKMFALESFISLLALSANCVCLSSTTQQWEMKILRGEISCLRRRRATNVIAVILWNVKDVCQRGVHDAMRSEAEKLGEMRKWTSHSSSSEWRRFFLLLALFPHSHHRVVNSEENNFPQLKKRRANRERDGNFPAFHS